MSTRLRHLWLALAVLPGLLGNREQRQVLAAMRVFCRQLPEVLKRPLPDALRKITPHATKRPNLPFHTLRQLADVAALLERQSPLGLCLRRSLTRFHFLYPQLPLQVQFGAKLLGQPSPAPRKITGHAWLTLNGAAYFEAEENWRDFTVMFTWPEKDELS